MSSNNEITSSTSTPSAQSLLAVIAVHPQLLHQEEAIARTPYDVSGWILYLDTIDDLISDQTTGSKKTTDGAASKTLSDLLQVRTFVGRRALQGLPKSYKLWKSHWEFCMHYKIGNIRQLWERALVTLHKFPRVWMEYLEYAHSASASEVAPTELRHLANKTLEALPVTQHDKIWPILLKYYQTTTTTHIPKETKLSLLRRYIQFNPAATKEVADFLAQELEHWGEAALLYVQLLNQPETSSLQRKDLWMSLAQICTRHPVEEIGIDWEALVRGVLANPKKFLSDELEGVVWNQLADAWIRRGEFTLARSVYEEALESVSKVRDFTILLDAYLKFEEGLLEAIMANAPEDEDIPEEGAEVDPDDWDLLLPSNQAGEALEGVVGDGGHNMSDLELALARAEDLTARRPILLNRVLLRQNPHDVGEWLKRARLYKQKGELPQAAAALEEALQTVFARRAVAGSPSQLVVALVELYENDLQDVGKARDLMDRICNQWVYEFKQADDMAECYAAWVEMELRQESWDSALEIIRSSVVVPPSTKERSVPRMVKGLSKTLRLWDLLLDLEESLGTVQTTKDAYNQAIEQRVATSLHVLNFATFLTEHKYFEESFSVYERGIELFEYPGVKVIWKAYLDAFLKRYGGTKLERTRDLFKRCQDACPPEESTEFFLMNGKYEEEHGLTKRALGIYRDMCKKVPPEDKYTAYQLFVTKTTRYMGQTATREIYQEAIQDLPDLPASQLCLDFAKLETSLQEFGRARAVFAYGAQMADPRRNEDYWTQWNEFEITHGNEETFREMLRIKRSVEASFSTVNYNAAEMSQTSAKADTLSNEEAMRMIAEQEGVELENQPDLAQKSTPVAGFVSAKRTAGTAQLDDVEERVAKLRKATASTKATPAEEPPTETNDDTDEIDIDDLDEDEDGDAEKNDSAIEGVSTKSVPTAVFGGLANLAGSSNDKQ